MRGWNKSRLMSVAGDNIADLFCFDSKNNDFSFRFDTFRIQEDEGWPRMIKF